LDNFGSICNAQLFRAEHISHIDHSFHDFLIFFTI
jgi:hypothetical protein